MSHHIKKSEDRIDYRDVMRTALILTGLFWFLLLSLLYYNADMTEKLHRILGGRPADLPYDLYMLLFTLQLSIPMLLFFRHMLITLTYARKRRGTAVKVGDLGAVIGLIGYLRYLIKDSGEGSIIRRSKYITFAGILYLLGLVAWWIWWADKHGI